MTVKAKRVSGRDPTPDVTSTNDSPPEMNCDLSKVFKAVWPDKRYKTLKNWTLRYWTGKKTMVSKVTCRYLETLFYLNFAVIAYIFNPSVK